MAVLTIVYIFSLFFVHEVTFKKMNREKRKEDEESKNEPEISKILKVKPYEHHRRQPLCKTRLPYRKGKRETAVKVFTIADESIYLLIQNVPKLSNVNVDYELKSHCYRYGSMSRFELVDYETEAFFSVYLVKYETLVDSRRAKKHLDDYVFLGSSLHVCYAPEYETVEETMAKMNARQRYVNIKLAQMHNLLQSSTS